MLSADDVEFLKALVSPADHEELKAVATKNLRSPTVADGRRPANPASHRPLHKTAPKRKATELSGPSDPMEPAARLPATAPGDDQAAPGDRQLGSPESGATYAAVAAASTTRNSQVGRSSPQPRVWCLPN